MSTVILDTITGKSTATTITIGSTPVVSASANSMTIRGEGSAQTSIQQGLAKQWVLQKQKSSHQTMDSFNTSSVDDHATAVIEPKFTNNMASDNYVLTGGLASGIYNGCMMMPATDGGDGAWAVATTGYYVSGRGNGPTYTLYDDIERVPVAVHGDLA